MDHRSVVNVILVLIGGAVSACSTSSGSPPPPDASSDDVSCTTSPAPPSEGGSLGDGGVATEAGAVPDGGSLSGLPPGSSITLTTLYKAPLVIEGLTGDAAGNLYAAGRAGTPTCPVWRIAPSGQATVVGNIPSPCSPSGLTFDTAGHLFVTDTSSIYELTPSDQTPPTATVFAAGVPGANGVAFDRAGNLWATDGTTGQGRVWSIAPDGTVTEAFRVQPLANLVNLVPSDAGVEAGLGGIGRDPRALPPGSLTVTATTRTAADIAGSVPIVANGILFTTDGTIYVADTARGAIWKVTLDAQGHVESPMGCDTTFTPDTLCLDDLFVEHPMLEGLDGFVLDAAGNIWGVANERNAVTVVTPSGSVREVFRNPPAATSQLRNQGPLEFPTSPFFLGNKLCITQSDVSRRDNFPNTGGEVGPQAAGPLVAKISCIDQPLPQAGLPLPVQ